MTKMRAVVTGGGGFLGSRIVSMLLDDGYHVTSFSRRRYPHLLAKGVVCETGDLADSAAVHRALNDADIVFHVAAKAGIWGDLAEYHEANVTGTRNVIAACRTHGIRKLVYTSTPAVTFDGNHARNANETLPFPRKFLSHYSATKAEAERLVLHANGPELATVALRPHLIWGPGDTQIYPRLAERARARRLVLIGGGHNLVDSTFIDNAAQAHMDAAGRLRPGSPIAGRVYFISQGDPRPTAELINRLLEAGGLAPIRRSLPVALAYVAASVAEAVYRIFRLSGEPPLTRFLVLEMARDHYFDLSAARRDLGYSPSIGIEEGLDRFRASIAGDQTMVAGAGRF